MNETDKEKKDQAAEDYRKAELDSLQMQLNAQRTRMEVLEQRVTSHANRLDTHCNDNQGHKEVNLE